MKKILFFILSIIISLLMRGQSLQFEYEEAVLNNGDTVTFTADATIPEVIIEIDVTNIGGRALSTLAKRNVISSVDGFMNAFCWGVCYLPSVDISANSVDLDAGETTNEFSGHLYNSGSINGEAEIMYTIFDEANPDDSVAVIVHYLIGETSALSQIENNDYNFSVYPNPTNDYCYVTTDESNYQLQIVDVIGKVVFKTQHDFGGLYLDLSDLQSGIYTVIMNKNDRVRSKRLVIQ